MKSATPKVLHPVAGRRMLDHVLAAAEALGPASVTVVVGHEGDRVREAYAGARPRFVVQEPQLGTGHALPAGRAWPEGRHGHAAAALGRRPAARRAHAEAPCRAAPGRLGRGDGAYGDRRSAPTATAASSARTAASRESSRSATPRPPSGRSPRSTPASTHSTSARCSTPSVESRPQNAQGEYYLPDSGRHLPAARSGRLHRDAFRTRTKSGASTAAASWRKWEPSCDTRRTKN